MKVISDLMLYKKVQGHKSTFQSWHVGTLPSQRVGGGGRFPPQPQESQRSGRRPQIRGHMMLFHSLLRKKIKKIELIVAVF